MSHQHPHSATEVSPLHNKTFLKLFSAQAVSLAGTGLTTIALALLAFELAPEDAGAVLASALALKMVAYVVIAPIVGGYADRLPRKPLLIALDLLRAATVLLLPFVAHTWQLFALILFLNICAAGFTPVFQAMLPDILEDEATYTKALSLSRLASELEALLSPILAALALGFMSFDRLFQANGIAFFISALLVLAAPIPATIPSHRKTGVWHNVSFGIRSFLNTPRLQGLLALHLTVAAGGAMVIVNTVVYVQKQLQLDEQQTAIAMIASGAGAMIVALTIPRILHYSSDRKAMMTGAGLIICGLSFGLMMPNFYGLLPIWFLIGAGSSLILTPAGRVIRLSCKEGDRSAYFSANFALSHSLWLLTYLCAGWMGSLFGLAWAFAGLATVASIGLATAIYCWPAVDDQDLLHQHDAIKHEHPHSHDSHHQHTHEGWEGPEPHIHDHHHAETSHRHPFTIDEHHTRWPS